MISFAGLFCTTQKQQEAGKNASFLIGSPADVPKSVAASTPAAATSGDEEEFDTVDSSARYLGLLGRLRTVFLAQSRLVAYSSEVGEAFRPVASPLFITGAYAVSWAYVLGDVGYEAYKMRQHGAQDIDVARTAMERGIFQSLASMLFPAYTVHWVVHQASNALKNAKPGMLKRLGPSAAGLAIIPFAPIIFDKPTEHAIEFAFNTVWPLSAEGLKAQASIHSGGHAFHGHEKKE
ncbi:hypothetical protein HDU98_002024 [Podochytrium sp. JEL0797]|nr:hypothetical protein HDU98_002024 [Podochytrium sp. JEL0797]